MKKLFKILFFSCILISLFFFKDTLAVNESFVVNFSDEHPGPNQKIDAKIVSYSFDENRSEISWYLNGSLALSGKGEKNFSFTTGKVGSKTALLAVIYSQEGIRVEKSYQFIPAEVDVLWEAKTHTPASYKGKAMISRETVIKITAFPDFVYNGSKLSPSDLYYDWEINYKKKPDLSGYGKRSFSYKLSNLASEENIKLTVSSYSGILIAEKTIKIKTQSPEIIFYEEKPLEGPDYNNALLDELDLFGSEIVIRAEPFFFSKNSVSQLSYNWKMNGQSFWPDYQPNVVDLRAPEGASASSLVSLQIQHPFILLQSAVKSIKINFGL
ncbi:MAG: hypothetical protein ABIJ28_04140 [Patescibacteria group bacterium]